MNTPQESAQYPRPPGRELMRECVTSESGVLYAVTCNAAKDRFYLYRVNPDGSLSKRLGSSKTPLELRGKII